MLGSTRVRILSSLIRRAGRGVDFATYTAETSTTALLLLSRRFGNGAACLSIRADLSCGGNVLYQLRAIFRIGWEELVSRCARSIGGTRHASERGCTS